MSKSSFNHIVHNCLEKSKHLIQKTEQENNKVSLVAIYKKIGEIEQNIKKIYGVKLGRIKIANAKTVTSYEIDKKENEYEWCVRYMKNLQHIL